MPSVDVIVPCYRYGRYLEQCVESILTQQGVDARVLVIDDASPDDTAEIGTNLARRDPRVTFIRHESNKGHIATYNEGIEWASGDYFLLLSADDYVLPGALERATGLMEEHPEVGLTFGRASLLYNDGRLSPMHPMPDVPESSRFRLMTGPEFIIRSGANNIVPVASAVVRTALQKRVGGYRPELPHSGDMEMWLRLAAHASVGFVNADQAVYRIHDRNMSQAYMTDMLPDLQQRKAALDVFFEECGAVLPDVALLRRRVYGSFGRAAVKRASAAFNEGQPELSERIAQYALGVCPEVRRSWPWAKFAIKRGLGMKNWQALRAARRKVRNWRFQSGLAE